MAQTVLVINDEPTKTRDGCMPVLTADGEIRTLEAMEADMIRTAIQKYQGRMTEVARRLGIGRSTLYRKVSKFGL